MNKHNTKYVGIDLGDKTSLVHVRNEAGEFVEETRLPTTAVALEREFGQRAPMRIAIEVGRSFPLDQPLVERLWSRSGSSRRSASCG